MLGNFFFGGGLRFKNGNSLWPLEPRSSSTGCRLFNCQGQRSVVSGPVVYVEQYTILSFSAPDNSL